MNYKNRDLERIARILTKDIEKDLMDTGIFYRIFFRCKSPKSLSNKLLIKDKNELPKYDSSSKFIRDIIGIRVNLYFLDDLEIITNYFKEKYKPQFVEETIDQNDTTEFKPTRVNLIYKIPEACLNEFSEVVDDSRIDPTFELQLRTIFSEGWHEVEHDLRYKCQEDWLEYPELARTLNGILASLETNEWSIIQLFERLSYSHYKHGELSAMLRTKLRIRFEDYSIRDELKEAISPKYPIYKEFFKLDRTAIINFLLRIKKTFPPNLENTIYAINFFFVKNELICQITPELLMNDFKKMH